MITENTLQLVLSNATIAYMKKKTVSASRRKASRRATDSSPTILRAYRFDAQVFARFETDCVRHLRNPRSVLEALILHWLNADAPQRDTIAEQYQMVGRTNSKLPK